MKIIVRTKPNAQESRVAVLDDGSYEVRVTAVPEKGRANRAVIEALAGHFNLAKSAVRIVAGQAARTKIVEVDLPSISKHSSL